MPKQTTHSYRLGRSKKYEGLIRRSETEYDLAGGEIQSLLAALPSLNEGWDLEALLYQEVQFFQKYMESKGIDSDYKGVWLDFKDGSEVRKKTGADTAQSLSGIPLTVFRYTPFIQRFYGSDPGAITAAKGLAQLRVAEDYLSQGDFEGVAVQAFRVSQLSRQLMAQMMEHQWRMGETRMDNIDNSKYPDGLLVEAETFMQEKLDEGRNKSDARKLAQKRFSIPAETLKYWEGKKRIVLKKPKK